MVQYNDCSGLPRHGYPAIVRTFVARCLSNRLWGSWTVYAGLRASAWEKTKKKEISIATPNLHECWVYHDHISTVFSIWRPMLKVSPDKHVSYKVVCSSLGFEVQIINVAEIPYRRSPSRTDFTLFEALLRALKLSPPISKYYLSNTIGPQWAPKLDCCGASFTTARFLSLRTRSEIFLLLEARHLSFVGLSFDKHHQSVLV